MASIEKAKYCYQCTYQNKGSLTAAIKNDFSHGGARIDTKIAVLCDGCGWTVVDEMGVCLHSFRGHDYPEDYLENTHDYAMFVAAKGDER